MQEPEQGDFPRGNWTNAFSPSMMLTLATVQVEGGLAVLAIAIAWFAGIPLREMFVFEPLPLLAAVAAVIPMLALCRLVYTLPFKTVDFTRRFMRSIYRDFIRHCSLPQLLLVAIMSGLGEELLFRGVLQTAITRGFGGGIWGLTFGILITSLLFGIAHPINKLYVFLCFVIGIYLGLVFHWSGDNLVVTIIIHALYNFIVFLFLPRMIGFPPEPQASDS